MNEQDDWDRIIEGLRSGDPHVCADFWNQYGPMLEGVASKQISGKLRRRVGADDVVQSACRTFFRRVSEGQFELPDADALWRLMCAITLTKARRAARDQQRQKRGLDREQYLDASRPGDSSPGYQLSSNDSPVEAVEVADQLRAILANLNEQECFILDLKLQQHTNDEIAEKVNCSERTVRRLMKKIQDRWTQMLDEADSPDEK